MRDLRASRYLDRGGARVSLTWLIGCINSQVAPTQSGIVPAWTAIVTAESSAVLVISVFWAARQFFLTRRIARVTETGRLVDNWLEETPLERLIEKLDLCPEPRQNALVRVIEATAAAQYFAAWRDVRIRFRDRDLTRIPARWLRADSRASVLTGASAALGSLVHPC